MAEIIPFPHERPEFEPLGLQLETYTREWACADLPLVRAAVIAVNKTAKELERGLRDVEIDTIFEIVGHLDNSINYYKALVELLECAQARILFVGERIEEAG